MYLFMAFAATEAVLRSANSTKAYPRDLAVFTDLETLSLVTSPNWEKNCFNSLSLKPLGKWPIYSTPLAGSPKKANMWEKLEIRQKNKHEQADFWKGSVKKGVLCYLPVLAFLILSLWNLRESWRCFLSLALFFSLAITFLVYFGFYATFLSTFLAGTAVLLVFVEGAATEVLLFLLTAFLVISFLLTLQNNLKFYLLSIVNATNKSNLSPKYIQ